MYYFGARYYDPEIAGWLVTDPVSQYHSPYVYVGGNPVNYVDPNGEFGFGIAFAAWVATKVGQGITRGIGDAFGLNASIQTDMSYSAGFSSNPGFVTDTGIPGGLGLSYTGNFGDDKYPTEVWLSISAPSREELERRYRKRLQKKGARLAGTNIALSGGSLGAGFSDRLSINRGRLRPNDLVSNYTYDAYAVAGTITGAFGSLTGDINAGKLIASYDGILRRNTGRLQIHRGYTSQYLKNSRALGGIGLAIGVGLLTVDLYYAETQYQYALTTAKFLGSMVGGVVFGGLGSTLLPGYGTFIGASLGATGGAYAAEQILNLFYQPVTKY